MCEHKMQVWHELDGREIYRECVDCGEQLYNPGTYPKGFREVRRTEPIIILEESQWH